MAHEQPEIWVGLALRRGYDVSTYGRVRSYWKRGGYPALLDTPRLLKPRRSSKGYVLFHVGGDVGLHVLMLEGFSGPRLKGMVCRHLDGNPSNNSLDNLCWGTVAENYFDAVGHGVIHPLQGEEHPIAKLTEDQIREIIRLRGDGHGTKEIGSMFGVHGSLISRIANRKLWTHVTI